MKTMFEETERQLGITVGFADAEQRETFLVALAGKVRSRVATGTAAALHEMLPGMIASARDEHVRERLQAMETKLNALDAELLAIMAGIQTEKPSDAMDEILKEHRAQQDNWRER